MRFATINRSTNETRIFVSLSLDGGELPKIENSLKEEEKNKIQIPGEKCNTKNQEIYVNTGIGFLNHMLTALAKHSGWSLYLITIGDLHIDDHHTAEDSAIALGQAFKTAVLSNNNNLGGITRFGYAYAPLDESLARAVVDISLRPFFYGSLDLKTEKIGSLSTEMISHILYSFTINAGLTIHIDVLRGENDHHKAEASFKALALALKQASVLTGSGDVPSTKGVL